MKANPIKIPADATANRARNILAVGWNSFTAFTWKTTGSTRLGKYVKCNNDYSV